MVSDDSITGLKWKIDDRFANTRADLHDSFLQNFASRSYGVAVDVAEAYVGAVAHLVEDSEMHLEWRRGLKGVRKKLRLRHSKNGVRDLLLDWWISFNFDLARAGLKEEREESWERQATKLE